MCLIGNSYAKFFAFMGEESKSIERARWYSTSLFSAMNDKFHCSSLRFYVANFGGYFPVEIH